MHIPHSLFYHTKPFLLDSQEPRTKSHAPPWFAGCVCTCMYLYVLVCTCMNSHVQHYTNALTLSVMMVKLMEGALGIPLVSPTHRYAGVDTQVSPLTSHRGNPRRSAIATWADGTAQAVWQFILHHSEVHMYLWWVGRVMAMWGSLDSSRHSSMSPGRVLHHGIRAQNVVCNSIGGHRSPTGPVWTGAQIAPCVTLTHCPCTSSSLGWSC